jgi:hypothetical protein
MSSKLNILNVAEFSVENLIPSAPKQLNTMGAKSVGLNYKFKDAQSLITVQTPWMKSFGINKWVDEKKPDDAPKLSVTLSFGGMESNGEIQALHDFLAQLDEWAIDYVHKNSWELLKVKNAPRATIAFNYTRSFKTPVDRSTGEPSGKPDNMKLKITQNDSDYSASFFSMDKIRIPADEVESKFTMGSNVRGLIQCTGFWIAAGKFGLSWKLKQMIIDPPSRIGKDYAFDDSHEVTAPPAHAPAKKSAPAPVSAPEQIEDSDEEEEVATVATVAPVAQKQAEPEPEVEAEPATAKKVIRKVVAKK